MRERTSRKSKNLLVLGSQFASLTFRVYLSQMVAKSLLQLAQDKGHQEANRSHHSHRRPSLLVSLGHHCAGQHGEDRPGGKGLYGRDHVPRSTSQKEVSKQGA